ncbi:class I SAM-dependent methyltransferase [Streptomyces sp. MUM 178J]|uniref:class I SAM-dependent methyltransferase n=1 Tax=Streptomyces sp. MUM 178J TaxID=2791991 RepID=UPI003FA7D74E
MQPKAFQPRPDGVKGAVNGFIHSSILPFGNSACTSAFSLRTVRTHRGTHPQRGAQDRRERVGRPATHGFDRDYWERHWQQGRAGGPGSLGGNPPNPYLAHETAGLAPGTALDAGCGSGAEAIWLASRGWHVTAADISPVHVLVRGPQQRPQGPAATAVNPSASATAARLSDTRK